MRPFVRKALEADEFESLILFIDETNEFLKTDKQNGYEVLKVLKELRDRMPNRFSLSSRVCTTCPASGMKTILSSHSWATHASSNRSRRERQNRWSHCPCSTWGMSLKTRDCFPSFSLTPIIIRRYALFNRYTYRMFFPTKSRKRERCLTSFSRVTSAMHCKSPRSTDLSKSAS